MPASVSLGRGWAGAPPPPPSRPPSSPPPAQALAIAACFAPQDWPLLIVCPSTLKLVWQDAVR